MNKQITVSVDAMGGDHGVSVTVPASITMLKRHPDLSIVLVGDETAIQNALQHESHYDASRLRIHHTTEVVDMGESPALALRNKKDSSLRVSINLVKEGEAQAAVSAGNTGALMATAKFVLKTLPGIDRPAICTTIPSNFGHTHMLDLGANVDCTADHLYQFAVMGSVLAQAVDHNSTPQIGLLNVGSEAIKGNDRVKEAARLLDDGQLNYIGFVEGDDIYLSDVDVVVCDGFVGNVSLKTSEGVAKMITGYLKKSFTKNVFTKLVALLVMPVLKEFKHRFDPRRYNGASLLGLQGAVIKSHGGADQFAFEHAINIARLEAEEEIPDKIDRQLSQIFAQRQAD